MTQVEAACFPDLVTPDLASQKLFLHLRNRILQMWLEDPKQQLTLEDVQKKLQPPSVCGTGGCRRRDELRSTGTVGEGISFQGDRPELRIQVPDGGLDTQ